MPRRDRPSERRIGRQGGRAGGTPGGRQEGREEGGAPRIIGGSLRGRRLPYAATRAASGEPPVTRPMKDRVRETLFDLLGPTVKGTLAIDLFAGTGALGFEALSRGAARAIFVERHFPTADALRRAAADLGVADAVQVHPGDGFVWGRRAADLPRSLPWLVFLAPPWRLFSERPADIARLLAELAAAAPAGSGFVVESDLAFDPSWLGEPAAWRRHPLPPAVLYLRPGAADE